MNKEQNLVWIDLEMTGLDPQKDVILEIATIITDGQLKEIAQGPVFIIHQDEALLSTMNDWVTKTHTKSGLVDQVRSSTITLAQAEEETLAFIATHCIKNKAILAGNSVWQDKYFLIHYMPRIIEYLSYRVLDVTSIKEAVRRWYENDAKIYFSKSDTHRSLTDIRESIEELKHYRTYFFI